MLRKEDPAKDAEVIQDLFVGFVDEVISDKPFITHEGKILSDRPVLEFGLGKAYTTRGLSESQRFRVVTPGKKEIGALGEAYLYYGVEFSQDDVTRLGIVAVTQEGITSEIKHNPNGMTQIISDRVAIYMGVCEPFEEE